MLWVYIQGYSIEIASPQRCPLRSTGFFGTKVAVFPGKKSRPPAYYGAHHPSINHGAKPGPPVQENHRLSISYPGQLSKCHWLIHS